MAKRIQIKYVPKAMKEALLKNNKGRPSYRSSKNPLISLTEKQQAEAVKLFNMMKNILLHTAIDVDINSRKVQFAAERILGYIEFDIDAGSRPLERAIDNSNMRGGIQKYLKYLS